MPLYIIRYAEIGLKGKNRRQFEKKLVDNIKKEIKDKGLKPQIKRVQSRILLEVEKEFDLKKIFGISSYSPCIQIKAELKEMSSAALALVKKNIRAKTKTFRITARRITKEFPFSSPEINKKLGAFIIKKTSLKVDLERPDLDLGIEIIGDAAFIFSKIFPGPGGLPVGVEGRVLFLVSEEDLIDKKFVLAAFLMRRRGCSVITLGSSLISNLKEAEKVAETFRCRALIVADTLKSLKDYPVNIPVLRPLVAFSDKEIKQELEKYKSLL